MLLPCALWGLVVPSSEAQTADAGSATPVDLRVDDGPTGTFQDELNENLHAVDDEGWQTEVLSSAAGAVLKKLVAGIADIDSLDPVEVATHLGDDFATDALRPAELEEAYSGGVLTVRRWTGSDSVQSRGADGSSGS